MKLGFYSLALLFTPNAPTPTRPCAAPSRRAPRLLTALPQVDGRAVAGVPHRTVVSWLQGRAGDPVTVTVSRPSRPEAWDVRLVRRVQPPQSSPRGTGPLSPPAPGDAGWGDESEDAVGLGAPASPAAPRVLELGEELPPLYTKRGPGPFAGSGSGEEGAGMVSSEDQGLSLT